uniref:WAPL domain-containing protein n=1 Tax=Rhabditophanes sp. KR3021 TaxID=114890 RepID=A0AC35U9S4_9BILA
MSYPRQLGDKHYLNPNHLHPSVYVNNSLRTPQLRAQGRSLSAREYGSQNLFENMSQQHPHTNPESFESLELDSSFYSPNRRKSSTASNYYRKSSSPSPRYQQTTANIFTYIGEGRRSSSRLQSDSHGDSSIFSYDIRRPSELSLQRSEDEDDQPLFRGKSSSPGNCNYLNPSSAASYMQRSSSCKSSPNIIRSSSPSTNISFRGSFSHQSKSDLDIMDFLHNGKSFDDSSSNYERQETPIKPATSLFLKRATRSVSKKFAQLKMGHKESRLQLSQNDLASGFSHSFDQSYLEDKKTLPPSKEKKQMSSSSRTDSTNSDDSYLNEKSTSYEGSSASLNIFTKNKKNKNDRRVQNGIRSSSATSKAVTPKRTISPPRMTSNKKINPISSSSQEIIKYCMASSKGDIATRIISRMCHKREDFAAFVTNLSPENLNEFTNSIKEYLSQVYKYLDRSEKLREISVQFGILQVCKRSLGFKADFFAILADAVVTEFFFFDAAAHSPTEVIESFTELVEILFSNIREGFYFQIRYIRRSSQCFNGTFSQSQEIIGESDSTQQPSSNSSIASNMRHPWTMHRQMSENMSENGCHANQPRNHSARYQYQSSPNTPIEPVMSSGVIINIKN